MSSSAPTRTVCSRWRAIKAGRSSTGWELRLAWLLDRGLHDRRGRSRGPARRMDDEPPPAGHDRLGWSPRPEPLTSADGLGERERLVAWSRTMTLTKTQKSEIITEHRRSDADTGSTEV